MTDHPEEQQQGPVVRDKRRIDPVTGELREPAATPASAAAADPHGAADAAIDAGNSGDSGDPGLGDAGDAGHPGSGEAEVADVAAELTRQVAERTSDLQRLQAEYANYRRRVDRDRDVVRDTAVANVLANLLPVLDDIGRARDHGELEGGFKSVGEALEQTVERLGLLRFGVAGEPFDPTVHEALTSSTSAEVTVPTAVEVFAPGYRIGNRVVRPARVAVAEPE